MLLILEKNGDQTLLPIDMEQVKEMVGVDSKHICDETECFCDQVRFAKTILYLDSFELPFSEVEAAAEARWNRPQVLRLSQNGDVYNIEYHGVQSRDVTADEVPEAIGRLIYIQDKEMIERRRLFNCFALVIILITLFLHLHVMPGFAAIPDEVEVFGGNVENER